MKIIETPENISHQPPVARIRFAFWDVVKMLGAAALCGLAVSIAAAGLTLLLSGNADAAEVNRNDGDNAQGAPGTLLISAGCDGMPLDALERDWVVRIDGGSVKVRVMQTWLMPNEFEGAAIFQARLPQGARLKTLSAGTSNREWQGRKITAAAFAKLSPSAYLDQTRNHLLVTTEADGNVSTSPIMDLQSGETLFVQYTYLMKLDADRNNDALQLALHPAENSTSNRRDAPEHSRGSVWVKWGGRRPARMTEFPREAALEHDNNVIAGLSWTTPAIQPGEKFRLAWAM